MSTESLIYLILGLFIALKLVIRDIHRLADVKVKEDVEGVKPSCCFFISMDLFSLSIKVVLKYL